MAPDSSSSAAAVLDSLIHASNSPVSFRLLSARLAVPSRLAQSLLLSYIASQPPDSLCVLWCVTHTSPAGLRRISLTTSPASIPSPLAKTVWSIAPPSLSAAPSPAAAWLAADAAADLAAVAAPPTEPNALRDGRYNAIRSSTAQWKPAEYPLGVVRKNTPPVKPVRKTSALLAQVKAKVKARDAKRAAMRNRQPSPTPWKPAAEGESLFASKRLGADAAKRIKEGEKKGKGRKEKGDNDEEDKVPVKKGRRLIDDDEDEDGDDESDGEKERVAMEKEAAEREVAEREAADAERAELQREVAELTRQHEEEEEDEPESPEIRDVEEEKQQEEKQESPNRSPTKRKLNEAFGLPSASGPRRIRREVEETVQKDDGYLVTRRVTKLFDENGSEVVEEEKPKPKAEVERPKSPPKSGFGKPLKPLNSQNGKSVKPKLGSQKKEKGKDGKRPSSKSGANGGAKKAPRKKIKGNIMSYFGKK